MGKVIYGTLASPADLQPVLEALESMQQSLDRVNAVLEQLLSNADMQQVTIEEWSEGGDVLGGKRQRDL